MDPKFVDAVMSEFEKLSHHEQVDLFLEIKNRLIDQRKLRTEAYKAGIADGNMNLEILSKGDQAMFYPDNSNTRINT